MSNKYPQMVYKAGGREQIHGGQFTTMLVHSDDELAQALADGWSENTDDAKDAALAEQERAAREAERLAAQAEAIKPPTREELEQKAAELGIPFSARVSDKRLGESIAAKLAAQVN